MMSLRVLVACECSQTVCARVRSKTFPGIAAAMAAQWHSALCGEFRLYPDVIRI